MDSRHKKLFLDTTRECFNLYSKSVNLFLDYFKKQIPIEDQLFPDLSTGKQVKFSKLKDEKSIKAA